jgi:hypothetical protein
MTIWSRLLVALALLLAACHSEVSRPHDESLTMCTEPRPEICTREYRPVCALHRDGSRKTQATGCVACSQPDVVGYRPGTCGADEHPPS